MENKGIYKKQENSESFVKKEPLTSAFSSGRIHETNLPIEVKTNPELLQECKERRDLVSKLDTLYLKIPTLTDIDTALENDLISHEEAEKFYTSIVTLIEKDEGSAQLLLYFPLELIPHSKNEKLQFFTEFYKSKWKELLKELNIRESFNIGDIVERELRNGPLAKVSKAAHLIPFLVEKDIITKREIFDLLENEDDDTIVESILDTCRILAEKHYLTTQDLNELNASKKIGVRNMANMIRYDQKNPQQESAPQESPTTNVTELFDSLNLEIKQLAYSPLATESIPAARQKWLTDTEKDNIREKYSEILYKKLSENEEDLNTALDNKERTEESTIVFIKSLGKLILQHIHEEKAYTALRTFKNSTNINIKNELLNTLNKLNSVNILNERYFSKHELLGEELEIERSVEQKVKKILSKIETDPLLLRSVYPITILYGSHIKGYGKENSDTDIAIFVKEEIDFNKHEQIKTRFAEILEELNIQGSVMEFWLTKEEDTLWIKDLNTSDNSVGDSAFTSPLTGRWYGDDETIQSLQIQLLPHYLYSANKKVFGFDARKVWLKDMEHSLIQYRLMHKGYKEKNLKQGGIDSLYKYEIDGESMFYDSGFRRAATKIYLEKVFLPQLKKE